MVTSFACSFACEALLRKQSFAKLVLALDGPEAHHLKLTFSLVLLGRWPSKTGLKSY